MPDKDPALLDVLGGIYDRLSELAAPHRWLKPKLFVDGNRWCALYGNNLQEGIAGFGPTPAEACANFDKAFRTDVALAPEAGHATEGPVDQWQQPPAEVPSVTWTCDFCYMQARTTNPNTDQPEGWYAAGSHFACPDCTRRAFAEYGSLMNAELGCFAGERPDPRVEARTDG